MQERVIKLVSERTKVDASQITPETRFVDDLKLDSLDTVELVMSVEDEFGIEISEDDAGALKSVQDVINYLEKKK